VNIAAASMNINGGGEGTAREPARRVTPAVLT